MLACGWSGDPTAASLAPGPRTSHLQARRAGCLQLLEISWNLKTLLEILEFKWSSWKFLCNDCCMVMALLHDDVALFVH